MSAQSETPFPPPEALPRAILVRNISPLATRTAIEDFFSFCGAIENHRLRKIPSNPGSTPTQEAIVIFTEPRARTDALVMDKSSIVDSPVTITPVPEGFDFNATPAPAPQPSQVGLFGGFSAFGDLFAGVGTAVAAEVEKASKMIDSATDTGVLKTAKDQVAQASQKTRDFATDLDSKYKLRDSLMIAAETGKTQATAVASAVATQTRSVAVQVDNTLHISENTGKLAERAKENPTVNSGISAFTDGFQNLMTQTGLRNDNSNSTTNVPTQLAQETNGLSQNNATTDVPNQDNANTAQ